MAQPKAGTTAHGGTGAAPGGGFPPFQGDTYASQVLWLALTFGVLYWAMAKIIVPRLGQIIGDRNARIAADLDKAASAKAKAGEAGKAYEASVLSARTKAQGIAQETRDSVNADSDAKRKALEAKLATRLAKAEADIAVMKTKAMGNVEAIATETAASIIAKLSGVAASKSDVAAAVKTALKG
jgi:F-type H+-transporting ATPase subunit b